ncbi:unnamed protein product, partial [marine sediment metagenome]
MAERQDPGERADERDLARATLQAWQDIDPVDEPADHYLWRAVDHEGEVLESYVTNGFIAESLIRESKED